MSPRIAFARGLAEHPALPDFDYAWLEAPLAARLGFVRDLEWRDRRRWPAGRVFGAAGEYRWTTRGEGEGRALHAVLLLDSGAMPDGFESPVELHKIRGDDSALLLWGDWVVPEKDRRGNPDDGPRFYTNEIPEVQEYPLVLDGPPAENTSPRLVVRRYRDAAGELGEFVRCVGVELRANEEKADG